MASSSTFTPIDVLTSVSKGIPARESELNQLLGSINEGTNQAELLKMQVKFQQYVQHFSISSALIKTIHDTQSEVIRRM